MQVRPEFDPVRNLPGPNQESGIPVRSSSVSAMRGAYRYLPILQGTNHESHRPLPIITRRHLCEDRPPYIYISPISGSLSLHIYISVHSTPPPPSCVCIYKLTLLISTLTSSSRVHLLPQSFTTMQFPSDSVESPPISHIYYSTEYVVVSRPARYFERERFCFDGRNGPRRSGG